MQKTNKDWAYYYLSQRFSIFPCGANIGGKKGLKAPLLSSWLEYEEKRPSTLQVTEWWNKWENAKIGIVCGKVSNIIVVDIDNVDVFAKTKIRLPLTPIVKTFKGFHYYFRYTESAPKTTTLNFGGVPFGEIRSNGSYVIAPPSLHHDDFDNQDGEYSWQIPLEDADMPEFDPSLFNSLEKETHHKNDFLTIAKGVLDGSRNNSAAAFIGAIIKKIHRSKWETEAFDAVAAWNQSNKPPLPIDELKAVFVSICNKELASHKATTPTLIKINELMTREVDPQPFIVDNIIKKNSLNVIHGATGSGKSLFLLKMVDDISCGRQFLDTFAVVKTKCLILDLEMTTDDCIVRTKNICSPENDSFLIPETSFSINDSVAVEWLKEIITTNVIGLVAFDTFSKIHSEDENSNSAITPIMTTLLKLCSELSITVVLLHHVNKNKDVSGLSRGRGATAIADNAGSYLEVASKGVIDAFGNKFLLLSVAQFKSRRRESISAFDIHVKYTASDDRTTFTYMGQTDLLADHSSQVRDRITKLLTQEPGLNKKAIEDRLRSEFSSGIIRNAIDVLITQGVIKLKSRGRSQMCFLSIDVPDEMLDAIQ